MMNQAQYNLWLAVYNQGLLSGLSPADSLANADRAVAQLNQLLGA